jgi:hypothetical protein
VTTQQLRRRLASPGPVVAAFMDSRAFIKFCIGPVGSGKTVGGLQCGLLVGAMQPGTVDQRGVRWRKARVGVIRESYPSLKSTTLKSWFNIVPESEGRFLWSAPFTHAFRKVLGRDKDGSPNDILDIEYEFRAIGDQTVEEACRGWEVNVVIVDEGDLQPPDLIPYLTGRVGRFSSLDAAHVVDPQIIVMMNMPDIENHAYVLAFDKRIEGLSDSDQAELVKGLDGRPLIETFVQPGGLDAKAENIHNLPGGRTYYLLQVAANQHKPGYIDRMVHNKPVPVMHGLAVNPRFAYTDHVRACTWDRRRQLIVGIDQGLFAAAVASQRDNNGDFQTLMECVNLAPNGKSLLKIGPSAFGRKLRQALLERFPGLTADDVRLVCDPAAFAAKDREDSEHDWVLAVQKALDLGRIRKAKSNVQGLRNEAIWQLHERRGGYAVDPSCTTLIKAHSGGYRYEKANLSTGETKSAPEIAETIYHNVADAEQYAALEGEHVISDIRGKARRPKGHQLVNDSGFDVFRGVA